MGRLRLLRTLTCTTAVVALALLGGASPSSAQPFNWLLPAGGETWTAGTTHTIEWNGGNAGWNVNVHIIRVTPFVTADVVALGILNNGYAQWSVPPTFLPGQYLAYVSETVSGSPYAYSQAFNIQAAPTCGVGCTLVSASMPWYGYPGGVCDVTVPGALAAAQSYVLPLLSNACAGGATLDPSSIVVDATILPFGVCFSGYSGQYIAEASAVGCCCSGATPSKPSSWGRVKTLYR
jgi:hypothetical protein